MFGVVNQACVLEDDEVVAGLGTGGVKSEVGQLLPCPSNSYVTNELLPVPLPAPLPPLPLP